MFSNAKVRQNIKDSTPSPKQDSAIALHVFVSQLSQCKGREISWRHISALYYNGNGRATETPGIPCFAHKLTLEHIHLTSFSKTRVDLAAQVHSHNYLSLDPVQND